MTILARCRTNKAGCSVNDTRPALYTPYITKNILVDVLPFTQRTCCLPTCRVHYIRYLRFYHYHPVDISAGGLLVPA